MANSDSYFVHIGLEHFVLNMITLYYLGRLAEDLFGSKAFLALYLLSGMMGNVFVAIFTPDVIAAGASTASLDFLGLLVLCVLLSKVPIFAT